jgi:hypothetical protein
MLQKHLPFSDLFSLFPFFPSSPSFLIIPLLLSSFSAEQGENEIVKPRES